MPFFLETDTFHDDPIWDVLADGSADLVDRLQSALTRLKSQSAHHLSWGYLTEATALRVCRGRAKVIELLCTPVLGEKPLLHRQGDECECIGDSWTEGYAYRIHNFSKRNPSKSEYNRNRAQKAELRDPRLKGMVYARDGGCCRYCTSGPLSPKAVRAKDRRKVLHYDHVDPDQTAGPDGAMLVVACGRCNEGKGKRTPDEADMVLLPPPTPERAAAMRARPLQLLDSPPADHQTITSEPASDHHASAQITDHDQKPITDSVTDRITDPPTDPINDHAAEPCPTPTTTPNGSTPAAPSEPSGLGRGGTPDLIPPAAARYKGEPRTSVAPDIYTGRSRPAPGPTPGPSPWPPAWPADYLPTTPPPGNQGEPR